MEQLLYRYFTLTHGLEALQTGRWKIGKLTELNDPFDCYPLIQSKLVPEAEWARIADAMVESLAQDSGLLCFSKTVTDPVLWSHYSESHMGLALGFDFSQEENVMEVKYDKDRPRIMFDELVALRDRSDLVSTPQGRTLISSFATKAPSWSYEQECRVMIDFQDCTLVGRNYFRNFPQHLLREVVLGARCPMSMADIYRIIGHSAATSDARTLKYPSDTCIRQCRKNPSGFTLEFHDFIKPLPSDEIVDG